MSEDSSESKSPDASPVTKENLISKKLEKNAKKMSEQASSRMKSTKKANAGGGMMAVKQIDIDPGKVLKIREHKINIDDYKKDSEVFIDKLKKDVTKVYSDIVKLQNLECYKVDVHKPFPTPQKGESVTFTPELFDKDCSVSVLISNVRNEVDYQIVTPHGQPFSTIYTMNKDTCFSYIKETGQLMTIAFDLRSRKQKGRLTFPTYAENRYVFILHFREKEEDEEDKVYKNLKKFEF